MRIAPLISVALMANALAGCAAGPTEFWQDYTDTVRAAGLLRAERAPDDAPIDAAQLTRSFRAIGFSFEADPFLSGDEIVEPPMIRKWRRPIDYALIGEDRDLARLRVVLGPVAADLTGLTGIALTELPLVPSEAGAPGTAAPAATPDGAEDRGGTDVSKDAGPDGAEPDVADADSALPNLLVLIGRDGFLAAVRLYDRMIEEGLVPGDDARGAWLRFLNEAIEPWYAAPSPCAGKVVVSDGRADTQAGEIAFAMIMIRAELPGVLLRSCVEEELAQVMGLFDDDDSLRPSVFNDDQEFALLTEHDKLLLRILYDPGLTVGMPPETAMPLVRRLAASLSPMP